MDDADWGASQWDVDRKADALHKSLFGGKKTDANNVKADVIINEKNGVGVEADSDDDETFSRKAKKKLKERKRKENKRNKSSEGPDSKNNPESEENVKIKSKKLQNNDSPKKQKGKKKKESQSISENKESYVTAGKEKSVHGGKLESEGKKKKRKNSDGDEKVEKKKVKKLKGTSGKGNSNVNDAVNGEGKEETEADTEESPKKKKKRRKKSKSNDKRDRNKYKHLGLKSNPDKQVSSDIPKVGVENITHQSKKDVIMSDKQHIVTDLVKPKKGKKRKTSESVEVLPAKKNKVDDSGNSLMVDTKMKDKVNTPEERNGQKEKHKKTKNSRKKKNVDETQKMETDDIKATEKSQTKNVTKKSRKQKKLEAKQNSITESVSQVQKSSSPFLSSQGNELQQKMIDKLASARFRFINEQLYTLRGGEAYRMFQQDKTLMGAYNTGFQGQVKHWPVNPLDIIIKQLKTKSAHLKVVDFGCGEARLSASVPQKVHSFDLFALNKRVTVCDMSKTPLADDSVDIVVFCLSLMGTNLKDYLVEANRVLKEGGFLKIAEVQSRFTNPTNFANAVSSIGFKAVNTRELGAMFYLMDFKKVKKVSKTSKQIKEIHLNPCVYKKR